MKIIADENIPYVSHFFGPAGNIIFKAGRAICRQDVIDADILLVRAVTKVNAELLAGTKVRFVGSPTSGLDHLDIKWLTENNILWSASEGCNTTAVVEYVLCVIAALQKIHFLCGRRTKKLRAGVVGYGKIGARVVKHLRDLNFEVLVCDPIIAQEDPHFISTPLSEFQNLDLISLHTPLTYEGPYPTYHLIKKNVLQRQKENCVLLNTSRGEIIDSNDLIDCGDHLNICLDVWENEPNIDINLLKKARIATPHIAGYSVQSKLRGVEMLYHAMRNKGVLPHYEVSPIIYPKKIIYPNKVTNKVMSIPKEWTWQQSALTIFDPMLLTEQLKAGGVKVFDRLRKDFNDRYEFDSVEIL